MPEAYYCVREKKPCVGWVEKYFKDCLCNTKDGYSFGFGIMSLVCWGVAEIPQIITNCRTKSSHGVSLAFLLTWVAGDVFNLVGCLLEPATLPTQYYTALLYTISTIVLVLQGMYYDHIYKWRKRRRLDTVDQQDGDEKRPLRPKTDDSGIPIPRGPPKATPRREFYYTSARSLAGSGTPPYRTYLRVAKSGPPAMEVYSDSSSEDETTTATNRTISQARPIPRSVEYGTFFATSLNLPFQSKGLSEVYMGFTGRRLLVHEGAGGMEHSGFGQWLGWLMAAIYMGGRVPQICLNIKRGSVEGLNPLMFIFALLANVTYVLSIVVRTTEWEKIKLNLPWLLDAVVCVALDLFVSFVFICIAIDHMKSYFIAVHLLQILPKEWSSRLLGPK
ncbi:probable vacuolar amino acid transporter YPQ2 isoform X2 [Tripterygium wilfordii]|uniref:probable vacuolar amino acid transporter YPQ2 isoform X2 n=1 Tax=Tripterygium wilfordii TaxID=458696 RepID=UPI0018F841DD|nr:probable vacuolar amino acid transporter YPQ2 isoform X2 [Tripterygium wilfordii]